MSSKKSCDPEGYFVCNTTVHCFIPYFLYYSYYLDFYLKQHEGFKYIYGVLTVAGLEAKPLPHPSLLDFTWSYAKDYNEKIGSILSLVTQILINLHLCNTVG